MRIVPATAAFLLALLMGQAPAQAAQDKYFTTSDGVKLHYAEAGRGNTVVFVPGWVMPGWIFEAQVAELSRTYHVVAFDPRSQGSSEVAGSGHEPGRRGQDIAELLAQFGPAPVVIVGWSLGVLDTLAYVHTHGDAQVAALVLVDNSVGENPPPSGGGGGAAPRRGRVGREASMRAFVRSMFARPMDPAYIERLTEAALRTRRPRPRRCWPTRCHAPTGARPCIRRASRCCIWCDRG